jgi:signal transduction histidine kinase
LPKQIKLYIFDDGVGCQDLKKGSGLAGMEQRVKEVGGTLEYGSGDEKGFNIYMEIPVNERPAPLP